MKSLLHLIAFWLVAALGVLALAGCAAMPVSTQGTVAVGKLTANLESAAAQLAPVLAHAQGEDLGHLKDVAANIKAAQAQAPVLERAAADDAATHEALKAEQNHWVGYKARHAILTVVLVGVGILVLLMALSVLSAIEPPVGIIAAAFFHTLTLGIPFVTKALRNVVSGVGRAGKAAAPLIMNIPAK